MKQTHPKKFAQEHRAFWAQLATNGGDLNAIRQNSRLQEDVWKRIDETVVEVIEEEKSAIADLEDAGMDQPLGNLGVKFSQWPQVNEFDQATQGMDFNRQGDGQAVDYSNEGVPVPITSQWFEISIRDLQASQNQGESLDTTSTDLATRAVSDKLEDSAFNGGDVTITVNGVQQGIPGYTTHTNRTTVSISASWTDGSPNEIQDILDGRQALKNNGNFNGPYWVYLPSEYSSHVEDDYKTESDQTIRSRIMSINGVERISESDFLADDNIIVLSANRNVVDLGTIEPIQALDISDDQMGLEMMIFAAMVVRIKQDYNNNVGVCHIS